MVGGGASAVCLLNALEQERDLPGGEITVFEASDNLWRGRPYRPDLDVVRVNSVPGDMSVRAGEGDHLNEWLTARELFLGTKTTFTDALSGAQFVPRAVYGDYLEQSARAALRALVGRGWRVELVRQRVQSATAVSEGLLLAAQTERYEVDYAVLSVGAGKPADIYSLAGSDDFIMEPYPTARSLDNIDPHADVAVIGSGLTAVDVVLGLISMGHCGRIRLCSRRGALPSVRQRPIEHTLQYFTTTRFRAMAAKGERVDLASLVAVMHAELAAVGEDMTTIRAEMEAIRHEDPVVRLRRNLGEVNAPSIALRILQQAVPEAGPDVWPLLTEHEKDRLLAEHDRTLMSLCCPMPPSSAATLLSLIDSGRLELVRNLQNIEPTDGGGFTITTSDGDQRAMVVVNAINARLRMTSEIAAPLIGSLVANGLAQPHRRGGLHVARATSRLTVDSLPDARLYALGDQAVGSLFFTFGVQSLVDRAVDIVESIREDSAGRASLRIPTEPARAGAGALQPA